MEYKTLRLYLNGLPEQTVEDAKKIAKAHGKSLEDIVAELIVQWVSYCKRNS